jgi:hypothetical protein
MFKNNSKMPKCAIDHVKNANYIMGHFFSVLKNATVQKKQPKWRLMEPPKRGNQLKSIGADAAADVAGRCCTAACFVISCTDWAGRP